jgi:hypothetical protein
MTETTHWVRRCDRCGKPEVYSVKDPQPRSTEGYCNHCSKETEGVWLPGDPEQDWRLTGQEEYLSGITLRRMPYFRWSESWDHDHCDFCGAEFMTPEDTPEGYEHAGKPIQHEGYTNEGVAGRKDHYWWVCGECFEDFSERFRWTVVTDS